ncbi:MAG TPA: hypothetical protein VJ870_04940 [Amycolatopsis sp.]|nr:hypothetical protein [Amycolatopsis sp.]
MTNAEQEPADVDETAKEAVKDTTTGFSPMGNWDPNTPPPVAPTGNWDPNTPPPAAPTGNWDPNTPPPAGNGTPAPAPAPVRGQAAGAWFYGRSVTNLFSSSANPGVWAWVPGVGWRRLASSETGRGPLITLALLAKTNGLAVSFHEDAAGQIDQLLV